MPSGLSPEGRELKRKAGIAARALGGGIKRQAKAMHKTNKAITKVGKGIRKAVKGNPLERKITKDIKLARKDMKDYKEGVVRRFKNRKNV